jgi:glycine betaine/proline transport system ATP-binding protein
VTSTDKRPPAPSSEKIGARGLWKFFGAPETQVRRLSAAPTATLLASHHWTAAVANAELSIRSGETFVIMGLSGSGKSTLLRCLCGLMEPSLGQVAFDGEDLTTASAARMVEIRRRHIGMVFQHYALLPHRSVLENIAFPLEVQGMATAERLARARMLAELVGLQPRLQALPEELSGGQQQRVGIARSLANDPDLWLLDEPFSALDPLIRRELQDELIRLKGIARRTVIFITHDFDEAARIADRIAIMRDGAIVQIGAPADLILRPTDDYVANFTEYADRGRVLTLGAVTTKSEVSAPSDLILPAALSLADAAKAARGFSGSISVRDDEAGLIGTIDAGRILDLLLGTWPHRNDRLNGTADASRG